MSADSHAADAPQQVGDKAGEPIDLRRRRLVGALLAAAGVAALPVSGLITNAHAADPQLTRETLNGIAVFFAPGPDPFSVQRLAMTGVIPRARSRRR